jgi:hypothetical protein
MRHTIFISIASYCDPLLWWTLRSAWARAAQSEWLTFGVVDQTPARGAKQASSGPWAGHVRYVQVHPSDSRGACWARALAFSLYGGEDYLLQVDSHTLFERDWDRRLVEVLEAVSTDAGNPKVVLSTRPFGFKLHAEGRVTAKVYTRQSLVLKPARGAQFKDDHPVLPFDAFPSGQERPVRGFQVAAGFLFTRGAFVDEVPYDPRLYFHGEEQNLAIRAFTRGWDIWHPNTPPLYHHYNVQENRVLPHGARALHWDQRHDNTRQVSWSELERASRARLRDLLFSRSLTGLFGLGTARTLGDFHALSGIDYEHRTIV